MNARGAAEAERRKRLEEGPTAKEIAPTPAGNVLPPPPVQREGDWPAKPKTAGRKAKKIRVSSHEAADALER